MIAFWDGACAPSFLCTLCAGGHKLTTDRFHRIYYFRKRCRRRVFDVTSAWDASSLQTSADRMLRSIELSTRASPLSPCLYTTETTALPTYLHAPQTSTLSTGLHAASAPPLSAPVSQTTGALQL